MQVSRNPSLPTTGKLITISCTKEKKATDHCMSTYMSLFVSSERILNWLDKRASAVITIKEYVQDEIRYNYSTHRTVDSPDGREGGCRR
ncbi:protein of unknown function [Maridesulfovibrio hydrothermalis AM13 = DSM 14728]|uniref:Uncharacterized protein n=1 Tax=Maridesulfovibrio hydrothermalis AM13 = DSM 14728 TaxID=1121451 RepID=L0RBN6_9BACT|nr:protein of unknown function [Maridesulfovibrio hydrothermalis AM13 = DSM 14728]